MGRVARVGMADVAHHVTHPADIMRRRSTDDRELRGMAQKMVHMAPVPVSRVSREISVTDFSVAK